jgi:sarcosine/dimethylglycine N-methyltransferase
MPELHDIAGTVASAKEYYDGPADEIYRLVWGDNIHLDIPCNPDCPHPEAMEHTNEMMAELAGLSTGVSVLDLGCGYGATARYLATRYGCSVVGVNISEKELELAKERTATAGLDNLITFDQGDFHKLGYDNGSFQVVWSQEAFLHGADKSMILSEAKRVLVPAGTLIFTDIVVRSDTSKDDRNRIYERIRSSDMWDTGDYRQCLSDQGFQIVHHEDWSEHVARSYSWIRDRVRHSRKTLIAP